MTNTARAMFAFAVSCSMVAGQALAVPASPSSSNQNPVVTGIARTTIVPACTVFVDAAAGAGNGSAQSPHKTISAAVAAASEGAVICVAGGLYSDEIKPGEKGFTLAGGFKSGSGFQVRDSAAFVSTAKGKGTGSFLKIEDPGPKGTQLTAIDGFEITGYSQGVSRQHWESQRFDLTNNFIHDNICTDVKVWGAGFALDNVSGTISGNVIRNNSCGRGGAGFINDGTNQNKLVFENNVVDGNAGTEDGSHGGGLYGGVNTLTITGNLFTNNTVTQWGGGLYIGAFTPGNQPTTATLTRNVYRGNKAGDSGGGFFCDDGATCFASHEIYDSNCGGNILVDGGSQGSGPTNARFDHITSIGAMEIGCAGPGIGLFVDTNEGYATDSYSVTNSILWGNGPGKDISTSCATGCAAIKVNVSHSMLETKYVGEGIKVTFGAGMVPPADPLFVDAAKGDFRLQPASPARAKASDGSDLGAAAGAPTARPVTAAPVPAAPASAPVAAPVAAPAQVAPPKAATPPAAVAAPAAPSPPVAAPKQPAATTVATPAPLTPPSADDVSAREAFAAAKELGTLDGWNAFLTRYPSGFHADLARAYMKKLGGAP